MTINEFLLKFTKDYWLAKVRGANFSYYDALEEYMLENPEPAKKVLKLCLELYEKEGIALLPIDFVKQVLQKLDKEP
jgi:hypothetical protein